VSGLVWCYPSFSASFVLATSPSPALRIRAFDTQGPNGPVAWCSLLRVVRGCGVYDTAIKRGGWSCSTVVLQLA
jgi:hypothetical protein